MKLTFICAILFVCLCPGGCKSGPSEAEATAHRYFDRLGTHCDDRYLTYAQEGSLFTLTIASARKYNGDGLAEYDGSSIGVVDNGLSDADKLNGIEWQGLMYLQAKTERMWSGNGWGLYQDVSHNQLSAIPLKKSKGNWFYKGLGGSYLTINQLPSPPQIDCAKYRK